MIYYNDELIEWRKPNPTNELAKEINKQISDLKEKFFGKNGKGLVTLLWPQGKRMKNSSGEWELKRPYPVELLSADGLMRYSPVRATTNKDKQHVFTEHHLMIKDGMSFTENDIEFIWFLNYYSAPFRNKVLLFEDTAGEAKKQVDKMAEDTELRFYLMGKTSVLANDEVCLRSIAEAFGVEAIHTLTLDEVKLAIYDAVQDGTKHKDPVRNYDTFIEFTQAPQKHKDAAKVRDAIRKGDLYFNKDEFSWFLKGDDTPFLRLKGNEAGSKEGILIDLIIKNPRYSSALNKYYGTEVTLTAEEVRGMTRPDLNSTAKLYGVEVSNSDKNPVLMQKIIDHLGLS